MGKGTTSNEGAGPTRLAVVPNFLPDDLFREIVEEAAGLEGQRVHIAGHKRGSTISYETLRQHAPEIVRFYQSTYLIARVSRILGLRIDPTPPHDQSSCSILIYDHAGDRIGWHYDHNFYNGRHFTALLPLVNKQIGRSSLSSAQLIVRINGENRVISTPPNRLVLFEGAAVRHQVTALGENERRWILSMTFCSDPTTTRVKDFGRRVKDIAYFGVRALWT